VGLAIDINLTKDGMNQSPKVDVSQNNELVSRASTPPKGLGLVAKKGHRRGDKLLEFSGELVTRKNVKNPNAALQVEGDLFLESRGTIDENLNHSCAPNCCVDFRDLTLVALRDIPAGEELTFDYNTSEYDLIEQGCDFLCCCGSENCIGHVKGFRYLDMKHRSRIKPLLSMFLRRKMLEKP
jgi:SET domain-containing protein